MTQDVWRSIENKASLKFDLFSCNHVGCSVRVSASVVTYELVSMKYGTLVKISVCVTKLRIKLQRPL